MIAEPQISNLPHSMISCGIAIRYIKSCVFIYHNYILDILIHTNIQISYIIILVDTSLVYSNIRIAPIMINITNIVPQIQQEVNN